MAGEKTVREKMPGEKSVRVRPAQPADLPRLVEIALHSATAAQWNQAEYQKLFAPNHHEAQSHSRTALVIERSGAVAGFIVGRRLADEWEIENIAVTGAARRCGLGTRLLGEFLRMVRAGGGTEVYLELRESNHAARALYEKWAFEEAGRRKSYYRDPDEDALVLRLSFPQPQ